MNALRPLTLKDLPRLTAWRNDRQLRNGTQGFRYPITAEMDEKWFHSAVAGGAPQKAVFAIQDGDGHCVGLAQLTNIDPVHRHGELGIFIGPKDLRGKGIGTNAVKELLDFGFSDLNLRRIHLRVTSDNLAAIKLYQTAGFEQEGCLKAHYFQDGHYLDVLLFAIMRAPK